MKIGISIWPETDAEWLELSLASLPGVSVELIARRAVVPLDQFQLLVVDADSPGPLFIQQQRQWTGHSGKIPIIFLGDSLSPALAKLPLHGVCPSYLPKPYRIADLRHEVARQLQKINPLALAKKSETPVTSASSAMVSKAEPAAREHSPRHPLGKLSSLRLSDLLQMLCLSQWTGKIEITSLLTGQHGCVYLNCGVLIHAEADKWIAEEACYVLLPWERCEFHFIEHHPPVVQTVNIHWQMILLEAARRMDEDLAVAS